MDKRWSTNVEELKAYFGFNIAMGLVKEPEIWDCWSSDPYFHYSPIASRISRDRYEEISRYLHFVDNTTLPERGQPFYSRLQKVQPIISEMQHNFSSVYAPSKCLSVDEAMIPFKGRSSMKQYMPKKPVKRGFKVWVVADSRNGYFLNCVPYVGATGETPCRNLGAAHPPL